MKISFDFELHTSNIYPVIEGNQVKLCQEYYGYIRELDKSLKLGRKVLKEMPLDEYKEKMTKMKSEWEDIFLEW